MGTCWGILHRASLRGPVKGSLRGVMGILRGCSPARVFQGYLSRDSFWGSFGGFFKGVFSGGPSRGFFREVVWGPLSWYFTVVFRGDFIAGSFGGVMGPCICPQPWPKFRWTLFNYWRVRLTFGGWWMVAGSLWFS